MYEQKSTYTAKTQRDVQTDSIKVPPHAIEAEQSVLGGLMLDNQSWDTVYSLVKAKDFYRYEHRLIFQEIERLVSENRPADVITLAESLKTIGELDTVGGDVYLFELTRNTPSVANIRAYAEIVRERSVLRQMIGVASEIATSAFNTEGQSATDLLDQAEQKVFQIAEQTSRGSGPQAIKKVAAQTLEKIDKLFHTKSAITGTATGFLDFDDLTSGLHPADLIVVAGRPSMGKTMFSMNIAENVAIQENKPVLVFSMEMPSDSIVMRMVSSLGRIDQHAIRSGKLKDEDWPRVCSTITMLSNSPMYIDDTAALTPGELRSRARRVAREYKGLGLIVVDYLQLMRVSGVSENRTNEISEISRSLKALAKELNVPVIALSQLNRSLEQRADKRPMMSDLRESGAIEQDADLIVFLYRDEVYNPSTPEKNVAEIIVAKHRNGPIGKVRLKFTGPFVRFENLAKGSYSYDE